ncbi:MAG: hypothetical protein M8349_00435 [ANME-2 cluster archaeon]|nr:hypothetical protein [ANME-2 cluster archaeon]
MDKKIEQAEITSMLHSCFFGLEKAHNKLTGSGHKAVVPQVARMLPQILNVKGELRFDNDKTLDENLQDLQDYFNNPEFFEEVLIEKIDDNRYSFEIKGCFLAKTGVHSILKPDSNTCMLVYIIASMINIKTGKSLRISNSVFSELGTKTSIEIV